MPDYLAHLQCILPSDVPPPLTIRGADSFFREEVGSSGGEGDTSTSADADKDRTSRSNAMANATGTLSERGVKVKWPGKRQSVTDMNKRVRALLEWVGREQACYADRERRKQALERELKVPLRGSVNGESSRPRLVVDSNVGNSSPIFHTTGCVVVGSVIVLPKCGRDSYSPPH